MVARNKLIGLNSTLSILITTPSIAISSCANDNRVIISTLDLYWVLIHQGLNENWRILSSYGYISEPKLSILVGSH